MELPFQTYERLYRKKWPGGKSAEIILVLRMYGIRYEPGSAEANLALQGVMLATNQVGAV